MADRPAAPFARTPGLREVRSCLRKQLHWHHDRERRAKHRLPLPRLCITSPGRPTTALTRLGFRAVRPGVYRAAPGLCIYVLVLSEVTKDRDTLLLRLLGSGRILAEAIMDLMALPDDAWEKELALPWLMRLGFKLPGLDDGKEAVVTEVREWFERYKKGLVRKGMTKGLQEGRQKGLQEGRREGQREALEQLCALRLGRPLSSAERAVLSERLERVGGRRLGEMLLGASAEALAAWLADPTPR